MAKDSRGRPSGANTVAWSVLESATTQPSAVEYNSKRFSFLVSCRARTSPVCVLMMVPIPATGVNSHLHCGEASAAGPHAVVFQLLRTTHVPSPHSGQSW